MYCPPQDIGMWQPIQRALSVAAILTNAGLIAYASRAGDDLESRFGGGTRIWFVFLFEHVVLAVIVLIATVIDDIPAGTQRKLASIKKLIETTMAQPTPEMLKL